MIFNTVTKQSNLDCFLQCATPTIRSQFLPKSDIMNLNRLWHPWGREKIEYFTLSNLWDCYDQWSAYGVGVPIVLNDNETLVQYYVPYLSAIQIFTSNLREEMESGDGERSSSDCFSDSCCSTDESESDKLWRLDGCWSSDDSGSEQDGNWHLNNRWGYLYFQYFETSTPYGRVPLMDKVPNLSYSNGKDPKGLVHMLPYLPYSIIFLPGNGCGRRYEDIGKEAKGRRRDLSTTIWVGNLQDSRECVGVVQ